jgi:polyketide cyclase/dehydrase/lipid transport protein
MKTARHDTASIHIEAKPEKVWSLLADVTRMGEWSPECHRVAWLDTASGSAPVPGARFKGWNHSGALRWTMTCEVKTAAQGREISWSTVKGDKELVRWTYRMEAADGGTDLTESFDVIWLPPVARFAEDFVMRDRDRRRHTAMETTLARIRSSAEESP